jgi:hypothetical protein
MSRSRDVSKEDHQIVATISLASCDPDMGESYVDKFTCADGDWMLLRFSLTS